MTRALSLIAAMLLLSAAEAPPTNWPCVQRYVPTLAGGTVWPDFLPSDSWRSDPEEATLVTTLSNRMMPLDDGTAKLRTWATAHPTADARTQLFAGLVTAINEARGTAVERIHNIDRRLQGLADASSRAMAELAALPTDTPPAQREAITERRLLIIREFDSINRMVRYACEIPPDYERRLGQFARTLQSPAAQLP